VRALVLLNPVGLGARAGAPARSPVPAGLRVLAALDPLLPLLCALLPRFLLDASLRAQVVEPGVLTDEVRAAYWGPFRNARGRRVVVQAARALVARPDHLARQVRQPVLIVEGSANPLGSPVLRDELALAFPGCTVEVLEGYGHVLGLEAPERLSEVISPWLSGHVPRWEQ
jgi:pimeloyl-ACP methyl ester carboxylesterase